MKIKDVLWIDDKDMEENGKYIGDNKFLYKEKYVLKCTRATADKRKVVVIGVKIKQKEVFEYEENTYEW